MNEMDIPAVQLALALPEMLLQYCYHTEATNEIDQEKAFSVEFESPRQEM